MKFYGIPITHVFFLIKALKNNRPKQLAGKQKSAINVIKKFAYELPRLNSELASWVKFQKNRRNGQLCQVDPILPSPVKASYRNKCEFTCGKVICHVPKSL